MTKTKRFQAINTIRDSLRAANWAEDRWGHFKKTISGQLYRAKFGSLTLRLETKTAAGWVRVKSAYYCNITVADGKLTGLVA